MLSETIIAILRRRSPHLPSGRLSFSNEGVSLQAYSYSPATNREMDCIARFIALTKVSYLESLELLASDSRVFRKPGGFDDRKSSGGSLYDLIIPLRTLRFWASEESGMKRENLHVKHVFSAQHFYELLRLISLVYEQERSEDLEHSVFLKQTAIFGPISKEQECNIWIMYYMLCICFRSIGKELKANFEVVKHDDFNLVRMQRLEKGYLANETIASGQAGSRIYHALPLFNAGIVGSNTTNRVQKTDGWNRHLIGPYKTNMSDRAVYMRGAQAVTVHVHEGHLYMTARGIPDELSRGIVNSGSQLMQHAVFTRKNRLERLERYQPFANLHGAKSLNKRNGELTRLVQDANSGHYYAARFLFSHALNGSIVPFANPAAAWFPRTHKNGEIVLEHLNVHSFVNVVGKLLETSTGHLIFPVTGLGKWCYLSNRSSKGSEQLFAAQWREKESTTAFARVYTKYNWNACIVPV